jgi:hypothetical protein
LNRLSAFLFVIRSRELCSTGVQTNPLKHALKSLQGHGFEQGIFPSEVFQS